MLRICLSTLCLALLAGCTGHVNVTHEPAVALTPAQSKCERKKNCTPHSYSPDSRKGVPYNLGQTKLKVTAAYSLYKAEYSSEKPTAAQASAGPKAGVEATFNHDEIAYKVTLNGTSTEVTEYVGELKGQGPTSPTEDRNPAAVNVTVYYLALDEAPSMEPITVIDPNLWFFLDVENEVKNFELDVSSEGILKKVGGKFDDKTDEVVQSLVDTTLSVAKMATGFSGFGTILSFNDVKGELTAEQIQQLKESGRSESDIAFHLVKSTKVASGDFTNVFGLEDLSKCGTQATVLPDVWHVDGKLRNVMHAHSITLKADGQSLSETYAQRTAGALKAGDCGPYETNNLVYGMPGYVPVTMTINMIDTSPEASEEAEGKADPNLEGIDLKNKPQANGTEAQPDSNTQKGEAAPELPKLFPLVQTVSVPFRNLGGLATVYMGSKTFSDREGTLIFNEATGLPVNYKLNIDSQLHTAVNSLNENTKQVMAKADDDDSQ